ncbi:hypothetical protein [Algoriphagus mannitolivorans]|uniref:hypothetical protein n=1 Tax=Algoriphagus mannitolivorans TaxID=226504 RepID=UPI00041E2059|nr:hypothetical protein [Algoriphagus mannitolivorans]
MANMIFKEVQTYRGTWLMYLILIIELPMLIVVGTVIWTSKPDSQEAIWVIPMIFLIMGSIFMFLMWIKLETRIDSSTIKYRYVPFFSKWKSIQKNDVKSIEVITYSPISDYGGWGLKGNSTTKAYSVLGDQGLLIDTGEKKKIMLGTQKAKELKTFIDNWREEDFYE